ncbi:MAG: hypothetical protein JNL83_00410 [Myxococcales bacterium]|nr:hypothetical protein [Myxococcales bacterium]
MTTAIRWGVQRRSGLAVLVLSLASALAFAVVWLCQTRRDLNRLGARIPTPWLLATPITALYFLWCWAEGARHVTAGRISTVGAFLALCLLGPLGMARLQETFNALSDGGRAPSARWYRPAPG